MRVRQYALLIGLSVWMVLLLPVVPAYADSTQPPAQGNVSIRDVGFDPHPDAQLPLDLALHDETGKPVRLGDYFSGRPILLTLNYYNCQNLCPLELQNLVDTMDQLPFGLGKEYAAVTVSFDPTNTAADATEMKNDVLHRYNRPDAPNPATGWHFLTGDETAIKQLTQTVGFKYAYDAAQKDYAHPVGAILLTPGGKIARYLYGMDFPPNDLRLALVEASQNKIARPIDAVLLLCYHYNPTMGRYSNVALGAVRVGGIITLLALGTFLGVMWRRDIISSRKARASHRVQEGEE